MTAAAGCPLCGTAAAGAACRQQQARYGSFSKLPRRCEQQQPTLLLWPILKVVPAAAVLKYLFCF